MVDLVRGDDKPSSIKMAPSSLDLEAFPIPISHGQRSPWWSHWHKYQGRPVVENRGVWKHTRTYSYKNGPFQRMICKHDNIRDWLNKGCQDQNTHHFTHTHNLNQSNAALSITCMSLIFQTSHSAHSPRYRCKNFRVVRQMQSFLPLLLLFLCSRPISLDSSYFNVWLVDAFSSYPSVFVIKWCTTVCTVPDNTFASSNVHFQCLQYFLRSPGSTLMQQRLWH